MNRLNYGKRYGTQLVSSRYAYDEEIDKALSADRLHMAAILARMPAHKKELLYYRAKQTNAKNRLKNDDGLKSAREAAEQRTAAAVVQAVAMLEFAITELNEHSPPKAQFRHAVNPLNIINAIHDLKTKCGVSFERGSGEFEHHIELDKVHRNQPPQQDSCADQEFRELTKQVNRKAREKQVAQHERLKTMREAAQRLAERARRQRQAAKLAKLKQAFQDSAPAPYGDADENS